MIKLDFATEKREERKKKGNTRRGKFLIFLSLLALYATKKTTKKNDVNDDRENKSLINISSSTVVVR